MSEVVKYALQGSNRNNRNVFSPKFCICWRPEAPHLLAACRVRVPAVHLPCQVLQGAGRPRLHHGASRSGDARHGGQVRPGHSNTLMAGCYRQFMLVDSKNKLITARVYPHMVLIEVSLCDGQLKLSYPGMTEITLSVPTGAVTHPSTNKAKPCLT